MKHVYSFFTTFFSEMSLLNNKLLSFLWETNQENYWHLPDLRLSITTLNSAIIKLTKHSNIILYEPPHDKTNEMACAPSEDSDQPGHPPSLIRVFADGMKKAWVLSYQLSAQWRLIRLGGCPGWSESSLGAQATLFVVFFMRRLICFRGLTTIAAAFFLLHTRQIRLYD